MPEPGAGSHRIELGPASVAGDDGAPHQAPWGRLRVTALEADLAYFQARIQLIGEPATINQKAQLATFRYLIHAVGRILNRLTRNETLQG